MAYRRSDDDLAYGERWDRDRFAQETDRNRHGADRERFEEHDRYYSRGPPVRERPRESSLDDRFEPRGPPRPWDDEFVIREKKYYDEGPRRSPPPEMERRVLYERDREREYRNTSPPRRPGTLVRRQSSLDTFDRRPAPKFFEREEYGPPARRADYRPDPYQPIPLPRSRALPPPRIYAERDFDEIKISEPERYGDEEYHAYPERIREREITRSKKRRDRSSSRTSRATTTAPTTTHRASTVRSSSRSSTTTSSSSSSSSSGGTVVTVKSEYPKKGKTRIPAKLVSKRAIIDTGYPFVEEGNTIIVQKALGQQNIDDLLKLSEDYKKSELEVAAARSVPGAVIEERKEEVVYTIPPPPPAPPTVIHAPPPPPPPPAQPVMEVVKETIVRDASPVRSHRSYSTSSYSTSTSGRTPLIIETNPREYSDEMALGPLALVGDRRRSDKEIKMEIARLEAERDLMRSDRHRHHHHHSHSSRSRHRSHSHSTEREMVRAERLPTGELVLYEEQVEKIEEPRRGVRIEKDKKGRMSISVPKSKHR
ncbi:Uu.00g122270.m01.CDS01 [Anthostomella pinea]|uniref:Uu.00g122270.m01.CDS01 n=1 Tax=Anthostomella pinea TaxID=933095 RepID=A0AAI8VH74_9PEZI|nr:Uu.00g122270.m01.CDS01 [Anthostomella pinea]